jgi:hypothetical protein
MPELEYCICREPSSAVPCDSLYASKVLKNTCLEAVKGEKKGSLNASTPIGDQTKILKTLNLVLPRRIKLQVQLVLQLEVYPKTYKTSQAHKNVTME